jgi:hypothetical protein
MILDVAVIVSSMVIYFFKRTKAHFVEGLLVYLSQFLGLYLIIIIWQSVTKKEYKEKRGEYLVGFGT